MSPIWIKICGITQQQDALAVAALGVDAIGLNFYPASPRKVSPAQAEQVVAELPPGVQVYGLFVDPTEAEVEAVLAVSRIDHLQFHGGEAPEFCASFGLPYMKACRVRDYDETRAEIDRHADADSILLDSYDARLPGGTGKTFDWDLAARLVSGSSKRIVLAGGLKVDNVGAAITTVRPYGVDVSSGVERAPGIKDYSKMQSFVEGVRSARP